ncbi:hypothetical protein BDV98DRAFT_112370 [Pterulicium gracile]|uniref:Protein kinase domain-containing protein n=1 Tax=Pterulicium gracile TaxID=1884261 RepID=A0A5C3QIQ7_9AGAR|nr:hypothetical protein BDV98DRAFT_112370 [Pterula gracilis]
MVGHKHNGSVSQNQKAQLAKAYNELGKELSSTKIKVVGNYTLGKVIGEGAYGKVRMGTHRLTSTRVAIKQIPKSMSTALTREIHHHRQLHHPNIMQMFEVIATESAIWIVTELCYGGELFDYLVEKGRLSEEETRVIFGQLCLAVHYLHEKGIVHRDLKLENVLLDEKCRVKLGDFGFTREYESNVFMETFCGTTGYASPEMLQGKKYCGPEVDIWSLGIILYTLLTGTLPFDDDDELEMRNKIIKGSYEDPEWLSADARNLLSKILQSDPSKRPCIANILTHPWFISPPEAPAPTAPRTSSASQASLTTSLVLDASATSPRTSSSSTPDLLSRTSQDISSEGGGTGLTTPDDVSMENEYPSIKRNNSEATIAASNTTSKAKRESTVEAVLEETEDKVPPAPPPKLTTASSGSSGKLAPPIHPLRTPARTKRRSISSPLDGVDDLDEDGPASPTTDKPLRPLPTPNSTAKSSFTSDFPTTRSCSPTASPPGRPSPQMSVQPQPDFASLLRKPAMTIFSTSLERDLLNTLSDIGYDTGQIVHSVLSDACDAAGAVWWMLLRKAERREKEKEERKLKEVEENASRSKENLMGEKTKTIEGRSSPRKGKKLRHATTQTDPVLPLHLNISPAALPVTSAAGIGLAFHHSAPQLALMPATPTFPPKSPTTPPSGGIEGMPTPMLSPASALLANVALVGAGKSLPDTPDGRGSTLSTASTGSATKGRKGRSGSVSMGIMQRATTALEAAGLVRKKSAEIVKDAYKEKERSKGDRDPDRRSTADSQEWGSIGSVGGKSMLSAATVSSSSASASTATTPGATARSPSMKAQQELAPPSTPPHPGMLAAASTSTLSDVQLAHPQSQLSHLGVMDSPWVLANATPTQERQRSYSGHIPQPELDPHAMYAQRSSSLFHLGSHSQHRLTAPTPANSPGIGHQEEPFTGSPSPSPVPSGSGGKGGLGKNRANILTAFGMWFDRKGKRKEHAEEEMDNPGSLSHVRSLTKQKKKIHGAPVVATSGATATGTIKRRTSKNSTAAALSVAATGGAVPPRTRPNKRHSTSSRRSSSVNSRRSSNASAQMNMLDPTTALRRTLTPDTGVSLDHPSRPSSIRSFSMHGTGSAGTGHHRKSPSASSVGSSVNQMRGASPLPGSKYYHSQAHRRGGSGSSTRVIRQVHPQKSSGSGGRHHRTGSTASSIQHSPASSRPASFYEELDFDRAYPRAGSPLRAPSSRRSSMDEPPVSTPRRTGFSTSGSGHAAGPSSTFIAQKRQGPFTSPSSGGSIGRTSWKKSWGLEPPGWQTRMTQLPVEIISVLPAADGPSIRDVFTRRPSLTLSTGHGTTPGGDEDDWVDEEDDIPPFAGGLGQVVNWGASASSGTSTSNGLGISASNSTGKRGHHIEAIALSAPPTRGHRPSGSGSSSANKRMAMGDRENATSSGAAASGSGHGQESGASAETSDSRGGRSRRDLPSGRPVQVFKMAIQEEEEEEE